LAEAVCLARPDGTLAANTCKDGLLGNMYCAKFTSTGTYAGDCLR
jgi:hypothetical protein